MNDINLITNDNKIIKCQIKYFSCISKIFDDDIKNKIKDAPIENYQININYKILNWVLNKYYVDKYFNDCKKLQLYRDSLFNDTNKITLIDIYIFTIDMNIIQLKYDLEIYITNNMISYFMPDNMIGSKFENNIDNIDDYICVL